MHRLSRITSITILGLGLGIYGCSSSSTPSKDAGGTGGAGTGGAGTGGAGTGGAGTGGSPGTGGAGTGGSSTGGASGDAAAPKDGPATSDGAKSDGATTDATAGAAKAVAMVMGTGGGTIMGTATFEQIGADVKLTYNLTGCPPGVHLTHIHVGPTCAAAAPENIGGGHWAAPRGEGLFMTDSIECKADMTFTGTYTRSGADAALRWTIGDNAGSDIANHVVIIHGMGANPPAIRHGCGVITKM